MEDKISQIFSISTEEAAEIWKKERPALLIGKISSKHFLEKLKKELHSDKSLYEILSLWKSLYESWTKDVDWELLNFVGELKNRYRVYLFTDTIDTHDKYNSTRGIYDKFTKVFRSHIEGVSKLGDDAFINVLDKINAKPEECVFIDDLEVNIKRAEALGMWGIVYKNKEELDQKLLKLGIKVD